MARSAGAPIELVVITGLSGAGRSTAAKCMEDLGWFVVDNLPPALLSSMAELGARSAASVNRIAVVVDVRGRAFFNDARGELDALKARGITPRILFLEATDEALVQRFEHVRRPHPLQDDGRLVDGIAQERELLRELRGEASLVLDTTDLNVHKLREAIDAAFGGPESGQLHLGVVSFGYKYGLPVDSDLVVDCRFLPNPHWVDALRPYTGKDEAVRDYVFSQPAAGEFVEDYSALLLRLIDGYVTEGRRYLTLAVGCTGGKHRSVAVAEALAKKLVTEAIEVRVTHRDLGRE